MNNPLSKSPPPPLDPKLIEGFIKNQEQELILKKEQIELQKQNLVNNHDYATKALSANVQDRADERSYNLTISKYKFIFAFLIISLLVILIIIGFYLGKDKIVMEIIKAIIYLSAGVLGGFSYGKYLAQEKK